MNLIFIHGLLQPQSLLCSKGIGGAATNKQFVPTQALLAKKKLIHYSVETAIAHNSWPVMTLANLQAYTQLILLSLKQFTESCMPDYNCFKYSSTF